MSDIVVTMTPDQARLFRAQEKVIAQAAKMAAGYKKVGTAAKQTEATVRKTAQTQERGFGGAAARSLGLVAAGYAGIAASVAIVNRLLEEQARLKREAAQAGVQSAGGLARLGQLADGQRLDHLRDLARASFAAGVGKGPEGLGQAADLIFSLESAGALSERELFTELGSTQLVSDPAKLATASSTLQKALGREETGSLRAIVSKGFGASKTAPASVEELLAAAGRVGGQAKALGISDEEVLAAVATVSTISGTDTAATEVDAFLAALDKKGGFAGRSLQELVADVEGRGLDGPDLIKFLENKRAVRGFRNLANNRALFEESLGNINEAQASDAVGVKLRGAGRDTSVRRAQLRQAEINQRFLATENRGSDLNLLEALREAEIAERTRRNTFGDDLNLAVGALFNPAINASGEFGERLQIRRALGAGGTAGVAFGKEALVNPRNNPALVVEAVNRLEEIEGALDDSAKALRAAAQANLDQTNAARLEVATEHAD